MKVFRILAGSLLTLGIIAVLMVLYVTWHSPSGSRPTPGLAGTAVAAGNGLGQVTAILPTPTPSPTPTVPPPPRPAPTMRATDPDLSNATAGTGVPAILPHLTPSPNLPAFTIDDVRAYVAAAGLGPGRARVSGPYQIESMTCQTSGELKAGGIRTGWPDDTLICQVKLNGTFTITGPVPPGGGTPQTHILRTFTLFFDGRTGNLLGQTGSP